MANERPNPEILLQQVKNEERKEARGKLKIYLGAAPGVGKTHEMLTDARSERNKGLDVVVGVVESHGRKEIEAMLTDLEILPRQNLSYRGKQLQEFDLDGALKRHPGLILIDEMAHTNSPGLRHTKRWQDIKELLDRGIDVFTTLNVQHIESLNDDITQIIHAPITETVPDSMLELADTIELVDIPPEELMQRLREGKVYIPQQAELAIEKFFRKGNLAALRELALRTTAARVGTDVLLYRQGKGIKHIWPTRDKILVCVGPAAESVKLIRAACRIAKSLHAEWVAVYVETPYLKVNDEKRHAAIQHLRLAKQLGADTRVLTGFDIVKAVMTYAREQNVTQIMIWKYIRTRWWDLFFRSLADEIVRHSREIDVYIMTGTRGEIKQAQQTTPKKTVIDWKNYVFSTLIVALATTINLFINPYIDNSDVIMLYVLAVTIVAFFGKIGPSILASLLGVITYTFFFVPPAYSFAIENHQDYLTLIVMLLVTQVISQLTILTKRQVESLGTTEKQTSALYTLSRQLASTRGSDKLLNTGVQHIAEIFNCEALALIPLGGKLTICAKARTKETKLTEKEESVAQWVCELGQAAGLGTDTLPFSEALYLPLTATQGPMGVLRLRPIQSNVLFTPEQMRLLETFANQVALALEVDYLQEERTQHTLQSEKDRARQGLLQSVSHDLRTPLLSILASSNSLMEVGDKIEGKKVKQIGKEIYFETEQLNHLINNLLQMAYFETDNIHLQKQPISLEELIMQVLKISEQKIQKRILHIEVPPNLPKIPIDHVLLQEVLLNLIDNAIKFTPPESPLEIIVVEKNDMILVSVEDYGDGIQFEEVDKLFEKYYRGSKQTSERGLGLGLTICKRIIEAHGGTIWAENRRDGNGAAFRFSIPLKEAEVSKQK